MTEPADSPGYYEPPLSTRPDPLPPAPATLPTLPLYIIQLLLLLVLLIPIPYLIRTRYRTDNDPFLRPTDCTQTTPFPPFLSWIILFFSPWTEARSFSFSLVCVPRSWSSRRIDGSTRILDFYIVTKWNADKDGFVCCIKSILDRNRKC